MALVQASQVRQRLSTVTGDERDLAISLAFLDAAPGVPFLFYHGTGCGHGSKGVPGCERDHLHDDLGLARSKA